MQHTVWTCLYDTATDFRERMLRFLQRGKGPEKTM